MAVDNKHNEYDEWEKQATKMETILSGEDACKKADFIGRLSGQANWEHEQYKDRAVWYPFTSRTLQALNGQLFRRLPKITLPASGALDYLKTEATPYGIGLAALSSDAANNIMGVGRFGALVDIPRGFDKPMILPYHGKNIINWQTKSMNGKVDLSLLVLKEIYAETDPDDEFLEVEKIQYRVLRMRETDEGNFIYVHQLWQDDELVDEVIPTTRGKPFNYIPFVFFNTSNTLPATQNSVLYELGLMNIHHYRWTAEEGHGLHFVALPTPWIAGAKIQTTTNAALPTFEGAGVKRDQDGKPINVPGKEPTFLIGSNQAWSLPTGAQVGILETSGSGIGLIQGKLSKLVEYMNSIGARLFNEQHSDETATAVRIQKTSESNALSHLANTLDAGFTDLLAYAADFLGLVNRTDPADSTEELIGFEVNREFISLKMDADEAAKFWELFMSDAIEATDLVDTFEKGELYPANKDKTNEVKRLEALKAEKKTAADALKQTLIGDKANQVADDSTNEFNRLNNQDDEPKA